MKISIPYHIYEQIQFYVDKSDIECSGLGKVVVTPEGYAVTEITLLKQVNTSTHTEIDSHAVTKAMYDLRNSVGGLYFWWHSHVNMGVFWSNTDIDTIKEIGAQGLCVAVVFNKKKEMRGAVWLKGTELSPHLYFDNVATQIVHNIATEETKKAWSADFEDKCKPRAVNVVDPFNKDYTGSNLARIGHQAVENAARNAPKAYFDLPHFETKLEDADRKLLNALSQDLVFAISESAVDSTLEQIIPILKRAKASKTDRRNAIIEYKNMALEQKEFLMERNDLIEKAWGQRDADDVDAEYDPNEENYAHHDDIPVHDRNKMQ